jgi:hypothetical protein
MLTGTTPDCRSHYVGSSPAIGCSETTVQENGWCQGRIFDVKTLTCTPKHNFCYQFINQKDLQNFSAEIGL